jgi:hypothetical protein
MEKGNSTNQRCSFKEPNLEQTVSHFPWFKRKRMEQSSRRRGTNNTKRKVGVKERREEEKSKDQHSCW